MSAAPLVEGVIVVLALVVVAEDGAGCSGEDRGRASSPDRSSSRGASTRSTWTRSHGGSGTRSKKATSPSGSPAEAVVADAASSTERAAGDSTASSSSEDSPSAHRLVHAHQPPPSVASSAASARSSARSSGSAVTIPSSRGSARGPIQVPRVGAGRRRSPRPGWKKRSCASDAWRHFRQRGAFSADPRAGRRARRSPRESPRSSRTRRRPRSSFRACPIRAHTACATRRMRAPRPGRRSEPRFLDFLAGRIARGMSTARFPRCRARNGHEIGSRDAQFVGEP